MILFESPDVMLSYTIMNIKCLSELVNVLGAVA